MMHGTTNIKRVPKFSQLMLHPLSSQESFGSLTARRL